MKKTESKKSRDTVPLKCSLSGTQSQLEDPQSRFRNFFFAILQSFGCPQYCRILKMLIKIADAHPFAQSISKPS
jgi:hypothetical protein